MLGGIGYWAHKTGKLEEITRRILQAVRSEEKKVQEPPKQTQTKAPPTKLPPINQGAPPSPGGGSRRAVAADAPAAAGESFFVDTREQKTGPSTGTGGPTNKTVAPIIVPKAPPKAEIRPLLQPTAVSSAKLLEIRQKAAVVSDNIGAEQISKTGGSDAGDIVSKVTGTSVVDGKFVVVRGLSDRYTGTTLNGAEVPSADPYRKSVQLDLFPSGIIEAINVTKTFTPDQLGTFTGGNINIVTKSFPEEDYVKFSGGVSYNTQATGNDDFLVAPEGSTDAFGWGRDIAGVPDALRNRNALKDSVQVPRRRSPAGETLDSANERRAQAEQLQAYGLSLGTTGFQPRKEAPPADHEFGVEAGATLGNFFGFRLGTFASFNYDREYSFYDDAVADRYQANMELNRTMREARGVIGTQYGGSYNMALGLSEDHTLRFNFLFNQTIEDEARTLLGNQNPIYGETDPLLMHQLHYTERQLQAYQLSGQHLFFPGIDNKLEWIVSTVFTSQDEPNYRFLHGNVTPDGVYKLTSAGLPQPNLPSRFFRELDEENLTIKLDDTQPFQWLNGLFGELKAGLYFSTAERTVTERTFGYKGDTTDASIYSGNLNNYLTQENLRYTATRLAAANAAGIRTNYNFDRFLTSEFGNNDSEGSLDVYAGYLMADAPLTEWMRLIGGVRYETTLYDVTGQSRTDTSPASAKLDEADLLPALGMVFNVAKAMNVRLHWSQTIARPGFREIAPGNTYDPPTDLLFIGNPELVLSHIDNYDLRWEWFRRPGEVLSIGAFYKDLTDPIELTFADLAADKATFINRDKAKIWGVELEARSRLDIIHRSLERLSLGANVSLIQSEVRLTDVEYNNKLITDPGTSRTRPLYDQSPYIINLDLSYDNPISGTILTLAANLTAQRLWVANPAGPDVYEYPAPGLDLIVSQRLGRYWKLKFSAKNLLDPEFRRTYGDSEDDPLHTLRTKGRNFSLSLSAEF